MSPLPLWLRGLLALSACVLMGAGAYRLTDPAPPQRYHLADHLLLDTRTGQVWVIRPGPAGDLVRIAIP